VIRRDRGVREGRGVVEEGRRGRQRGTGVMEGGTVSGAGRGQYILNKGWGGDWKRRRGGAQRWQSKGRTRNRTTMTLHKK